MLLVLMRLKFFAMICCLSIKPLAVNMGCMNLDGSRLFKLGKLWRPTGRLVKGKGSSSPKYGRKFRFLYRNYGKISPDITQNPLNEGLGSINNLPWKFKEQVASKSFWHLIGFDPKFVPNPDHTFYLWI